MLCSLYPLQFAIALDFSSSVPPHVIVCRFALSLQRYQPPAVTIYIGDSGAATLGPWRRLAKACFLLLSSLEILCSTRVFTI
jgi:hypothetical protein